MLQYKKNLKAVIEKSSPLFSIKRSGEILWSSRGKWLIPNRSARAKSMDPRSTSVLINLTRTRSPTSRPSNPCISFPYTGGWNRRTEKCFRPYVPLILFILCRTWRDGRVDERHATRNRLSRKGSVVRIPLSPCSNDFQRTMVKDDWHSEEIKYNKKGFAEALGVSVDKLITGKPNEL